MSLVSLLPSEVEIVKIALTKLELESIVPPAKPNDSPEVIKEKKANLSALHSLCKKLLI